jgi:Tfp pilus assembly protein PilP
MRSAVVLALALSLVGCGGEEKSTPLPARPSARPGAAPPGSPTAALQPTLEQSKEQLLAEVRKRQLTADDFKESPTNRDPFRSFLTSFATPVVVNKQHKVLLEKFALEELKLVAIVSGDGVQPRAMFVDPTGMGVSVVRGDHVSKADATVTRIAPDRIFFQMEEDLGTGKPKIAERVIELHANENVTPQ